MSENIYHARGGHTASSRSFRLLSSTFRMSSRTALTSLAHALLSPRTLSFKLAASESAFILADLASCSCVDISEIDFFVDSSRDLLLETCSDNDDSALRALSKTSVHAVNTCKAFRMRTGQTLEEALFPSDDVIQPLALHSHPLFRLFEILRLPCQLKI